MASTTIIHSTMVHSRQQLHQQLRHQQVSKPYITAYSDLWLGLKKGEWFVVAVEVRSVVSGLSECDMYPDLRGRVGWL